MISNQILSHRYAHGCPAMHTRLLLLMALFCIGWAQPSQPLSPPVKASVPTALSPAQLANPQMTTADLEAFLNGLKMAMSSIRINVGPWIGRDVTDS